MNYPILTVSELLRSFVDEYPDVKLREDDFHTPQKQRWQDIYMTLVSLITDVPKDLLELRFFNAIKDTEYLDINKDGLSLCLLTKALQRKLEAAYITNFSTKDITEPSEKRLCNVLSAILNYLRFKSACEADYHKSKSKVEDREKLYEALKKENDELISRINSIRAAQAEQEPKTAKVREENEAKKKRLAEIHKQISALQTTGTQLKTKASELTAAAAKCSEEVETKKREIDRLDSLIVHSPERAAREKTIMEEKLVQLKAAKEDKVRRLAEMKAARSLHRSFEGQQACEMFKGIYKVEEREREMMKEMKSLQNKNQQRHQDVGELDAKKQSLQRSLVGRQEKLDKIMLQHRVKEDAMKSQLHECHEAVEKLEAKDGRVRALEDERRELHQKVVAQRQEFVQRREDLDADKNEMLKVFAEYNKKIHDAFTDAMSVCTLPDLDSDSD